MTKLPNPKINYSIEIQTSHGYFKCPECGSEFYAGGKALHHSKCSKDRHTDCVYNFGDKEIRRIQSGFNNFGFSWLHGAWTELAILRDFGEVDEIAFLEYKEKLLQVKSKELAEKEYEALSAFFNREAVKQ